MDNYDATFTVYKSPPLNRKQCFDYLEIDDETKEDTDRSFPAARLAKRKNLRVTFSDHIEVDVIEDIESAADTDCGDADDELEESTLYEIPFDRGKELMKFSSSSEFKTVTEKLLSPGSAKTENTGENEHSFQANETWTKCQTNTQPTQKMLYKRNPSIKLTLNDLGKKNKEHILKLQGTVQRAETQAKIPQSIFPHIASKAKPQANFKEFIANAKHAVETTRIYERPWISGTSNKRYYNVGSQRSDTVRRTASLPRNFRLPNKLSTSRPASENVLLEADNKQR